MTSMPDGEVIAAVDGPVGHLVLNRPERINALTLGMVRQIAAALQEWESDPDVSCVLLEGRGERGLCAGADLVALHASASEDGGEAARTFWREEYSLNMRIASYPKPFIAVMDGIVMGGGVGLSGHASHRVATERLVWAMPEVMIGFAPDVGATYLLSRAPGEVGTYLGLTAARIGAADAVAYGFADYFVESDAIGRLREELARTEPGAAIGMYSGPPPRGGHGMSQHLIDAAFGAETVEAMSERLRGQDGAESRAAQAAIAAASPTSLKVTLRALRGAAQRATLEECLELEYTTSCGLLMREDFREGIRAVVFDKTRAPVWSPSELSSVSEQQVHTLLSV
jgi:enoyl-CoA hydratase